MVAAQHQRQAAAPHTGGSALCNLAAHCQHLSQVAQARLWLSTPGGHLHQRQVAGVQHAEPHCLHAGSQPGIAQSAGAHVHPAPPGAKITGHANQLHLTHFQWHALILPQASLQLLQRG